MRLIDADVLKAELWKERASLQMMDDSQTADKIMYGIYKAERCVSKMPTVDAAPVKHGHDTGEGRLFHCSVCGYDVFDIFEDNKDVYRFEIGKGWDYCPNCGAKMDEEAEK